MGGDATLVGRRWPRSGDPWGLQAVEAMLRVAAGTHLCATLECTWQSRDPRVRGAPRLACGRRRCHRLRRRVCYRRGYGDAVVLLQREGMLNGGRWCSHRPEVVLHATRGDASSGGTRGDAPGQREGFYLQLKGVLLGRRGCSQRQKFFFSTMLRYKIFFATFVMWFCQIGRASCRERVYVLV